MTLDSPKPDKLAALAAELAAEVCRRYRIAAPLAAETILRVWSSDAALAKALLQESSTDRLKRTRAYKRAAAAAKKAVYYQLRRYRADDEPLRDAAQALQELPRNTSEVPLGQFLDTALQSHVSTAERLPHRVQFIDTLLHAIGFPTTLLDVGCGLVPLLFPFDTGGSFVSKYCAVDRDPHVVELLTAFSVWRADQRLAVNRSDLALGWQNAQIACGAERFDVALILKLVPVIHRQQPALLDILRNVPARRVVVTGARDAMVRRRSIERRELAVITEFLQGSRFRAVGRFETPDEVGFVAQENAP